MNLHHGKFGIKLYIPAAEGMEEIWLRFDLVGGLYEDLIHVPLSFS